MFSLITALALISFTPAAEPEVAATRLDGTAVTGKLRSWDDEQVVIANRDAEQRVATDQLLSLEWGPPPERSGTGEKSSASQMELIDGSLIPIDDFRSSSTRATVQLAVPQSTADKALELLRKQIAAVRLQPLSAEAAEQWREIRERDLASDVLVLLKRGGKSLDYVEGVLGDLSPGKIEFKLDGDLLRIDRAKVAGFLYYRNQNESALEPRCKISGRSGLRVNASQVRLVDGLVHMTTTSGAALKWPLHDIYSADFSAGKLQYLSDVEPASERWTPLVGLPSGAELAAEYGRPRRNQSAYGGPLSLQIAARSASLADQTHPFKKGLALRSHTELVYRVPAGFRRFTTMAGIDPFTSSNGNVRLEIYGDDRLLLEDDIAGQDPPDSIELDISGVKRLKIVVDYGRNLDTGDWLNLCDARFVK